MFRQCVDGETLVDNQCVVCPPGSYSLQYDPTTKCKDCPPFTTGCYGSTILASPGYWRIDSRSIVMLECPYGNAACHGGSIGTELPKHSRALGAAPIKSVSSYSKASTPTTPGTVDTIGDSPEGCARGYEGPLCAVCSKGYYFSSTTSTCVTCEDDGQGQLAIMILVPLILLLLVVFFTFTTFLAESSAVIPIGVAVPMSSADFFSSRRHKIAITPETVFDPWQKEDKGIWKRGKTVLVYVKEWMTERVPIMFPKVKIMLTVYQITSSLPFALEIKFGSNSTHLLHSFR